MEVEVEVEVGVEVEGPEVLGSGSVWDSWVPWDMEVSWWDRRQGGQPRAAGR